MITAFFDLTRLSTVGGHGNGLQRGMLIERSFNKSTRMSMQGRGLGMEIGGAFGLGFRIDRAHLDNIFYGK